MTDKVQKIKEEIERRIESMNSCPFKTAELGSEKFDEGELYAYKQILQFINSIPEETKSQFPNYESIVDKVFGAGNLESFERSEAERLVLLAKEELLKDLEINKEPTSEDLEEYAKKLAKGAALDKHNLIWMCKKGAEWQKKIDGLKQEPASEDLEIEIGKYTTNHLLKKRNHSTGVYHLTQKECDNIARHFAEWQENKNAAQSCKNLYAAIKENQEKKFFNDDFEKASYAQGMIDGSMWYKQQMKEALQTEYEKGRYDMREEMMKDAIEGEVYKGYVGKQIVISSKDGNAKYVAFDRSYADAFNIGEKVKIIIVN